MIWSTRAFECLNARRYDAGEAKGGRAGLDDMSIGAWGGASDAHEMAISTDRQEVGDVVRSS